MPASQSQLTSFVHSFQHQNSECTAMEQRKFDWETLSREPDIIYKIVSYLKYIDIHNLENSSWIIKTIFSEIKLWERKIRLEYPGLASDSYEDAPNDVYWQARYLNHICDSRCYNLCNTCLEYTHCFNITRCDLHSDSQILANLLRWLQNNEDGEDSQNTRRNFSFGILLYVFFLQINFGIKIIDNSCAIYAIAYLCRNTIMNQQSNIVFFIRDIWGNFFNPPEFSLKVNS